MSKTSALALIALVLAAPALTAQQDSTSERTRPTGAQIAAARTQDTSPLITLRFPGGSLPEYVEAVKLASRDNPVNVVIRGEADDVRVPQVFLERVSAQSALELVAGIHMLGDLAVRTELTIPGSFPGGFAGPGEPIYLLEVRRDTARRASPAAMPMPSQTLVVSIRDIISPLPGEPSELAMPREAVLTAIEAALTTTAAEADPSVRFHEDTGLVILHAPPDALSAAQGAINAISADLARRREMIRAHSSRSTAELAQVELELADAATQVELQGIGLERARQRIAIAEQELTERRLLAEKEAISPAEVRESEERLNEARAMARAAEIERERAAKRIAALQALKTRAAGEPGQREADAPVRQLAAENAALRERVASLESELRALREEVARLRGRDGGAR
ncbi:MAG: hypothetical protein KJZ54_10885 [Phycisphaerales bacterium]|nr:hypothetical protein [Phycisphaerales bacterium]